MRTPTDQRRPTPQRRREVGLPEVEPPTADVAALGWLPLRSTRCVPVGCWWDAIRVPEEIAIRVYDVLGPCGPVLANPYSQVWHFLLDPGSAGNWHVPPSRRMRAGSLLAIPPGELRLQPDEFRSRSRDVHWAVPPGRGRTQPVALNKALTSRRVAGRGSGYVH